MIPLVFIYILCANMPSFIPFRKSSVVKMIYDAISRNSSRIRVYRSSKTGLLKTIHKKNTEHPDIYGPQQDVCGCQGGGCPRCWKN